MRFRFAGASSSAVPGDGRDPGLACFFRTAAEAFRRVLVAGAAAVAVAGGFVETDT